MPRNALLRYLAGALIAAGFTAPVAMAYPGDPMAGCETTLLGATYCDGPVRPDGTWQRCAYTAESGGFWTPYIPPTVTCRLISMPVPPPPWQPDHHIDP